MLFSQRTGALHAACPSCKDESIVIWERGDGPTFNVGSQFLFFFRWRCSSGSPVPQYPVQYTAVLVQWLSLFMSFYMSFCHWSTALQRLGHEKTSSLTQVLVGLRSALHLICSAALAAQSTPLLGPAGLNNARSLSA